MSIRTFLMILALQAVQSFTLVPRNGIHGFTTSDGNRISTILSAKVKKRTINAPGTAPGTSTDKRKVSDQIDDLVKGAAPLPSSITKAVSAEAISASSYYQHAPFKAPSAGRWIFFSAVPLICGSFAWELLSKQPGGFDAQLLVELMLQYTSVFGVFIGLAWVRAEHRGVAFFTRDRGYAQRITDDGPHQPTGLIAPFTVIAISLSVIAAIAAFDERFNAFR